MARVRLVEQASEEGTYIVNVEVYDDSVPASLIVPVTLSWTLSDNNGNVVNSLEDVAVVAPTNSNYVVLSGDDLQILDNGAKETRIFSVKGTYDSQDFGNDLPFTGSARFEIRNLKVI